MSLGGEPSQHFRRRLSSSVQCLSAQACRRLRPDLSAVMEPSDSASHGFQIFHLMGRKATKPQSKGWREGRMERKETFPSSPLRASRATASCERHEGLGWGQGATCPGSCPAQAQVRARRREEMNYMSCLRERERLGMGIRVTIPMSQRVCVRDSAHVHK